jgi:hypothetical protein
MDNIIDSIRIKMSNKQNSVIIPYRFSSLSVDQILSKKHQNLTDWDLLLFGTQEDLDIYHSHCAILVAELKIIFPHWKFNLSKKLDEQLYYLRIALRYTRL